MLVTGFPYDVHGRVDEFVGLFAAFVGQARAVRRLGSAAIDLCYVAAGRMDGFWETDLKPWDVAAGALIVSESGGRMTRTDAGPFASRSGDVLATNGRLHDQMLEVIRSFRARRSAVSSRRTASIRDCRLSTASDTPDGSPGFLAGFLRILWHRSC